ncbi:MAG: OmpA family protein, partial [Treponema sp.]|nr:OmpA family protein [Treponema sp.]
MKKWYFTFIFFVFYGISVFGDNNKQEEIDFLLFLPNSSNLFADEEQAFIQLDNLAQYLSNKNFSPGQIIVYGYTAFAPNDIEPIDLSRERAVFVINELQRRGISKNLFSEPVGYGSVNLWGDNTDEDDRKLNRRVRVLLDGESPLLITQEIINSDSVYKESILRKDIPVKSGRRFPWWNWLLILALFTALIFLLLKKRSRKTVNKTETVYA